MRPDLLWALLAIIALLVQAMIGNFTIGLSQTIGLARSSSSSTEPDPEHMPVARSEHEINRQQQRSAERYSEIVADESIPEADHQPDDMRRQSETVIEEDLALRCGEKLPPESAWTTRGVEIFVKAKYRGSQGGEHVWGYTVSFRNRGIDTVQMLTRHWVFTDATGRTQQMKGPGARGVTPVLAPGDSWQYESGASLATSMGSMHGSFQFATLQSASGTRPRSFSARVARLTLSASGQGALTKCPEDLADDMLQTTSVHATRRVIVGASTTYVESMSNQPKVTIALCTTCKLTMPGPMPL